MIQSLVDIIRERQASILNAEVTGSFRYKVSISGLNLAIFSEIGLPSLQVETLDIKEGGQNEYIHRLPVRVNAGTLKLKRGITGTFDLMRWYSMVLAGDIENARRDVTIVMYDTKHNPLYYFDFANAYPIRWTGPSFRSESSAVAIEELELAYHGFSVE